MRSDSRPEVPSPPALVISELPRWIALLGGDDPLPDLDRVAEVDAAGVQLLASALVWHPGRLRLDAAGDSPVARLWRRLGLDAPADADAVKEGGATVALRLNAGGRP